jgi:hypothetical protein
MVRRSLASGLLLLTLIAACSALQPGTPAPTPARPLGPGERWLPVANWTFNGTRVLCAGTGFVGGFFLHGSQTDSRIAWMTFPDGSRHEIGWPLGYSARFVPGLEVLDEASRVIAREGSPVAGGCLTQDRDVWSVGFDGDPAP